MDIVQYPKDEVVRYDPKVGPSDLVLSLPHYHKVNKGTGAPGCEEHLAWRRKIVQRCRTSKTARADVLKMCKEDMCFWFNFALWLYEPRDMTHTIRPFNVWPHQAEAIAHIEKYMGRRTIGVEKSRGEGASWLVLMTFLHQWLFFPLRSFGVVSKDEKTASDYTNTDSLVFKFIWQLDKLQETVPWMLPKGWDSNKHYSKSKGTITNPQNKSVLNTWSAVGSAGTGGRKTAVLMDELAKFPRPDDDHVMASMQPVTDCRILVSTPFGDAGAYYNAMHTKGTQMLKIVLHWPMNPTRNRGLYRWDTNAANPVFLDDDGYDYPEGYEFVQDGKLRSPWYDKQAAEPDMIANPRALAQEYDLNYGGSTVKFYTPDLRASIEPLLRAPALVGEIDYDAFGTIGTWVEMVGGRCSLWCTMGNGRPIAGKYVVGVDIAAGVGGSSSSNSAIVALDADTGEQVLEWKCPMTDPPALAQQSVAICKWLAVGGNLPLLVWENNGGYGVTFTAVVRNQLNYSNCFRERARTQVKGKRSMRYGYRTVDRTDYHNKIKLFLLMGRITIRSENLFTELSQFEYNGDKVVHVGAELKEDGATGKAHGDIVSALGMACVGLEDIGGGAIVRPQIEPPSGREYPANSMGARFEEMERKARDAKRDLISWL